MKKVECVELKDVNEILADIIIVYGTYDNKTKKFVSNNRCVWENAFLHLIKEGLAIGDNKAIKFKR